MKFKGPVKYFKMLSWVGNTKTWENFFYNKNYMESKITSKTCTL